jgi:hypothetical protein
MSELQIIEKLCGMLGTAQEIIREQAELLAMHGITTADGKLEERREALLKEEP